MEALSKDRPFGLEINKKNRILYIRDLGQGFERNYVGEVKFNPFGLYPGGVFFVIGIINKLVNQGEKMIRRSLLHYKIFSQHYETVKERCLSRLYHSRLAQWQKIFLFSIILLCSEINLTAPGFPLPQVLNKEIQLTSISLAAWSKALNNPINIYPPKVILAKLFLITRTNQAYRINTIKELIKLVDNKETYYSGSPCLIHKILVPDSLNFSSIRKGLEDAPCQLTSKIGPVMTHGPPYSVITAKTPALSIFAKSLKHGCSALKLSYYFPDKNIFISLGSFQKEPFLFSFFDKPQNEALIGV